MLSYSRLHILYSADFETASRFHGRNHCVPLRRQAIPEGNQSRGGDGIDLEPSSSGRAALSTDAVLNKWRSKYSPPKRNDNTKPRRQTRIRGDEGAMFRRAIGVDFGTVRTGVAFSAGGVSPRPFSALPSKTWQWNDACKSLVEIAIREHADGFVVGLPVTAVGNIRDRRTDSKQGRKCRLFAEELADVAAPESLGVVLFDESMTTSAADSELRASGKSRAAVGMSDCVAAGILLQEYFEARARGAVSVKPSFRASKTDSGPDVPGGP